MDSPNSEMAEYWTSATGPAWVAEHVRMDRMLAPLGDVAMARLRLAPGARVIDVGCGCGDTTLALADAVGAQGSVLGVDVSATMLARARERVAEAGVEARVQLRLADAQVADLGRDADGVFSRLGVMFFADPVAAFRNMRGALRKGGRLSFVCWQSRDANPWLTAPVIAAAPLLEMPPPPEPDAPGPFGLADPVRTNRLLSEAGYKDIEVDALVGPLHLGDSLEDAVDKFMVVGAVGSVIRRTQAPPAVRVQVRDALAAAMAQFVSERGVVVSPSAAWVVTATA